MNLLIDVFLALVSLGVIVWKVWKRTRNSNRREKVVGQRYQRLKIS